jgi:hypothetical protein
VELYPEVDTDISIRGGVKEKKSDFKTICFKINQNIPTRNSKRKLQNMVQRKMTRTKLEICNLAQKRGSRPPCP